MEKDTIEVLRPHDEEHRTYILVTGANSGLGFAICQRLIDEFVQTRPQFESLTLIPTTRDETKSKTTVAHLQKHIAKLDRPWEETLSNRVTIQPELLDLTSLSSVRALATKLMDSIPHLDTIICNAGFGGVTGIDWLTSFKSLAVDFIDAVTYPQYKIGTIGSITAPQAPFASSSSSSSASPPRNGSTGSPPKMAYLGTVFTSNVFGHYLLTHFLLHALALSPDAGRIIFVSSIEAIPSVFDPSDLQGLTTNKSYESSKRLTDILVLTSSLPSTAPFVTRFLTPPASTPSDDEGGGKGGIHLEDNDNLPDEEDIAPRIELADHTNPHLFTTTTPRPPALYLTHPGICATNFVPLPYILQLCMALAFYIARWLGSPWHTVSTYKGAKAPVWMALALKEEIEDEEVERGGAGKWGSCCDRRGKEGVRRTGVGGWVSGEGGEVVGKGEREEFEGLGRECWRGMEVLRVAWEERLGGRG